MAHTSANSLVGPLAVNESWPQAGWPDRRVARHAFITPRRRVPPYSHLPLIPEHPAAVFFILAYSVHVYSYISHNIGTTEVE